MNEVSVKGHSLPAMCRLCLSKGVPLLDIFYFSAEMRNQLSNIIMWCAPVQIRRDENMPNFICQLCYTQIKKIHEFQIQIVESDKTLRRYVQQLHASDKQIKPDCSIQNSSKEYKTNHYDVNVKCESVVFYDIFGINLGSKEIAPINYDSVNKINEEMPLKFEIKNEPMIDNSLNLTECALFKSDGAEIVCEDTKVDISYYAKLGENMRIIGKDENFKITNKIKQELPLKFEIKDEPIIDNSLNLTECAAKTVETLYKSDGAEIVCEDTKVDISYYAQLGENMRIIGKDENFRTTNKINQELPLKFEIKDEPMFDNSLNLTECAANTVESGDSEIDSKVSNIDAGLSSENDVANCPDKEKYIAVNNEKLKKVTEKKYHCKICNKRFTTSFNLNRHTSTHSDDKPFQCNVCQKCFRYLDDLNVHKRTHTEEKPYTCKVCEKIFNKIRYLMIHERTHNDKKPHQCDICKKSFCYPSALIIHKRTHTGEKPYQCDVCNKCFANPNHFILHKRTHTGEKPYRCDVCNKCFTISSNLNVHKRSHTGEKLYQCDVCNKYFSTSGILNVHKRSHTGEKPYQCDVCKVRFSQSSHLIIHKRTHTSEKPLFVTVFKKIN